MTSRFAPGRATAARNPWSARTVRRGPWRAAPGCWARLPASARPTRRLGVSSVRVESGVDPVALRDARLRMGLTQHELARLIDVAGASGSMSRAMRICPVMAMGSAQCWPSPAWCSGQWAHPLTGQGLGQAHAFPGGLTDVSMMQEPVDGRGGEGLGISSSNAAGWRFEESATERFS